VPKLHIHQVALLVPERWKFIQKHEAADFAEMRIHHSANGRSSEQYKQTIGGPATWKLAATSYRYDNTSGEGR
jgi:hypothetical protein